VERLSARERERVAELVAEGAPFWRLLQEVPRSRYAIYRAVKRLKRPPAREPNGRRCGCLQLSGRRSRVVWPRVSRCVSSLVGSPELHRRCLEKWPATAAARSIGRVERIGRRSATCADRRSPSSPGVRVCGRPSKPSSGGVGRRSRSRVGWSWSFPTTRRCGCRTRRSTCRDRHLRQVEREAARTSRATATRPGDQQVDLGVAVDRRRLPSRSRAVMATSSSNFAMSTAFLSVLASD